MDEADKKANESPANLKPEDIARALGADIVIGQGRTIIFTRDGPDIFVVQKQTRSGRVYLEVIIRKDGRKAKKRVYDLAGKSLKRYVRLGKAEGFSLDYCFFLAIKYRDDFLIQVCGFRFEEPTMARCNCAVSFYAKKQVERRAT